MIPLRKKLGWCNSATEFPLAVQKDKVILFFK